MNRSPEELAMREALTAWARPRWPGARIVHELVVTDFRVDMAIIERDNIIGIEIKSSRDTLDRLDAQLMAFRTHLPSVILALAPKWQATGRHGADELLIVQPDDPLTVRGTAHFLRPRRNVTVQMLELLWASEARAIASRTRVASNPRLPLRSSIPMLARALTGDEIVREVCRELRARDAFPKCDGHPPSDPPIYEHREPEGVR